jgi:hypothetical protein
MPPTEIAKIERTETQLTRSGFAPTSWIEAKEFAEYMSKSDMVPRQYVGKPANIMVAMQHGMELGLPPMQALQSIAVINGTPSIFGDSMLAVVMAHPDFVRHEEFIEGEGDARVAVFVIERRGHKPHTSKFSVEDAKRADLWDTRKTVQRKNRDTGSNYDTPNDSPWYCYPERMLKFRARGFGLRDKFPDALRGIKMAEEVSDYRTGPVIDAEIVEERSPRTRVEEQPVAQQATTDPAIGMEKANEWYQAWKKSGWTKEHASKWMKDNTGVESSKDIPSSKFDAAMTWARTLNPEIHEMAGGA